MKVNLSLPYNVSSTYKKFYYKIAWYEYNLTQERYNPICHKIAWYEYNLTQERYNPICHKVPVLIKDMYISNHDIACIYSQELELIFYNFSTECNSDLTIYI